MRSPMRYGLILLLAVAACPSLARAQAPETIEYYGSDTIGSIRIVFDVNGTVLGRQDFTPFGTPVVPAPTMPKEAFGGNEKDDETVLSYFHARMFQARSGRFNRPDPVDGDLSAPQAWNRYAYAANNPLTFTDPAGLFIVPFLPPLCPTFVCDSTGVTAPLLPIGGGGVGGDGMIVAPGDPIGGNGDGIGDTIPGTPVDIPAPPTNDNPKPNNPPIVPPIVPGHPRSMDDLVRKAFLDINKRLDADRCAGLYGGHDGANRALQSIPEVRIVPFPNSSTGAATLPNNSIFINSGGAFFQNQSARSGSLTIPASQVQSVILLHELGHVAQIFGTDSNDPSLNQTYTAMVYAACFSR